jgi:gliding motility-associated-like protein
MRNQTILFFILCFVASVNSFSQTYNMANGNISTCSGTFYDNGGLGLYSANQNITQTFTPSTLGNVIQVNFTSFQTEASLDVLCIYNGPNTTSPLLGCYSGTNTLNGISFKSTHPTGSLTFSFTSDASIQLNGWAATISCTFGCQSFVANADSTFPIGDTNDIIKVCIGSTVDMFGDASYPNSGTHYNQSNSTSTFTWKTGDGFTIPGKNVNHTFNTPGVFYLSLIVEDTIGCKSVKQGKKVIVSLEPSFKSVTILPSDSICFGDTATIIIPDSGLFDAYDPPELKVAGVTAIPDIVGTPFTSIIPVSIFSPAATFGSGYLKGIYLNAEHSYLGDLEITITCPNGQTATLKENPGGGNTFLGEPIDNTTAGHIGNGYTYEFTNLSPTYGTMVGESGNYTQTYIDNNGLSVTNSYLPAGSYTSFQNLNTRLNGCPLNGNWTITVTDHLTSDDGYIFYWGLNFDTLIRPPLVITDSVVANKVTGLWTGNPNIIGSFVDSSVTVSPTTSGTHGYKYQITDDFGCTHDTTINIYVKPKPKSDAGMDFTTCLLNQTLAPTPIPGATVDSWNYFTVPVINTSTFDDSSLYTPNATVTDYGVYNYILQERLNGCLTYPDTVEISYIQVPNTINISVDKDTVCIPETVVFTNNSDMTFFDSIYWEFGDGGLSNSQGTASHIYNNYACFDVKVTLINTLGCSVDSIFPSMVCGFPTPVADFVYDPTESIIPNTLINFTNQSTGATNYLWDFAGLGNSIFEDDFYIFPKFDGGVYPVTLFVDNEGGCNDEITKNVTIKNTLSFWAPSSFTPNDDDLNDNFSVVFNNNSVEEYQVFIFNRWGELMFSSPEIDFEWDGTYNGKEVPNGVYIWRVVGKEKLTTESFEKIGHVTLTR